MYLNKRELEAIYASIDFISHHADGAEDYTPFEEMKKHLRTAWEKGVRQRVNISKYRQKSNH